MKRGFTIVELLVVVVVIAILATVVIASYNGLTKKAVEAGLKSDLSSTATKLGVYKAQNGTLPNSLDNSLKVESGSNQVSYVVNSVGAYCISAKNTAQAGLTSFFITDDGVIRPGSCSDITYQISGGFRHTLRAAFDGSVYAWGDNTYGQIGDGTTTSRSQPVNISGSSAFDNKVVIEISAGFGHSLALTADGIVYAWGDNTYNQIGDGTTTRRTTPVNISSYGALAGKTIVQIRAGYYHSLALASDGTLVSWGRNDSGQLGDGTTTNRSTPINITNAGLLSGKTITQIGVSMGGNHSLAVASGAVYAWGLNDYGQLGDGTTTNRLTPIAVTASGDLSGKIISQVVAGRGSSLVLATDGTLYAWGNNGYGQVGDGTTTTRLSPVALSTSGALVGKVVKQIATGYAQSLALTSDNVVYAWGKNDSGMLGDGTTTNRLSPVSITGSGVLAGKTPLLIGEGIDMASVITADPGVYTFGRNDYAQLGDGTTTNRSSPTIISFTSN